MVKSVFSAKTFRSHGGNADTHMKGGLGSRVKNGVQKSIFYPFDLLGADHQLDHPGRTPIFFYPI
jgi:hypothetical protein